MQNFEQCCFVFCSQFGFQFWIQIKMIFNCPFISSGNKDHISNTCSNRLFNSILN